MSFTASFEATVKALRKLEEKTLKSLRKTHTTSVITTIDSGKLRHSIWVTDNPTVLIMSFPMKSQAVESNGKPLDASGKSTAAQPGCQTFPSQRYKSHREVSTPMIRAWNIS